MHDGKASKAASAEYLTALEAVAAACGDGKCNCYCVQAKQIIAQKDVLVKKSFWVFGGDGFAYDIGFGGLDHVIASGEDINIFIFDTEVYSNTGGQSSKSSPTASIAKFTYAGKRMKKKDLGLMAMSYGYVYVAQIAMGASYKQTLDAIAEAEAYPGPSLIIAYSPCIAHGLKKGMGSAMQQIKDAVDAGYWHMYRYNPLLEEQGKNPFTLDSKKPEGNFLEFIDSETRYSSLKLSFPEAAQELFERSKGDAEKRYDTYRRLAEQKYEE